MKTQHNNKNGNNNTIAWHLADIERRAKLLTQKDALNGKNPLTYVNHYGSFILTDVRRIRALLGTVAAAALLLLATSARADDRRGCDRSQREERHNYILERQQAYQVQGVPTERLIIGKREIDVYRNGVMFEKNNVVGFMPR